MPGKIQKEFTIKHLPFADRTEAGRILAAKLASQATCTNGIVLALARGGVPVGFSVAERLHLPLDVVIVRKLGVPWQPELALGAITADTRLLDDQLIGELGIPAEDIEEIAAREQVEIARRENAYRNNEPPADLHGRTVILVDDGMATGSTMLAVLRHMRRLQRPVQPSKLIVATPVLSRSGFDKVSEEADQVVYVAMPELFFSVGEWYRDFPQVSDEEVRHLMLESRRQFARASKAIATA